MTARSFRDAELARFEASGWCRIDPLAAALRGIDPVRYLRSRPAAWWSEAAEVAAGLRERSWRFGSLATPKSVCCSCRRCRSSTPGARSRYTSGGPSGPTWSRTSPAPFSARVATSCPPAPTGPFFLTLVGRYGVNAGSHEAVAQAPPERFQVAGIDTRQGMIRQLWGARVLQADAGFLPDTDANDRWTFTLFAGDELDAGRAASGTVLKSRVRFRLGKPDRGIGSARVAPAVPLGAME